MKWVAWILFVSGTLVAAAWGAKMPPDWGIFGVGIVVAVVGAVLLRRQIAAEQAGEGASEDGGISNLFGLRQALEEVVALSEAAERTTEGPALKGEVEKILMEHLLPIVEARLMLVGSHGVEAYARVFNPLAAGERTLNRAWSALVDGNLNEAMPQIPAARRHFSEALAAWPANG